jgi:hypothetical protein
MAAGSGASAAGTLFLAGLLFAIPRLNRRRADSGVSGSGQTPDDEEKAKKELVMRGKPPTTPATIMFGAGMLWAQPPRTIHGFVSDAHCGVMHSSPSVEATRCMQKCMREGSPSVIVSSGRCTNSKGPRTMLHNTSVSMSLCREWLMATR